MGEKMVTERRAGTPDWGMSGLQDDRQTYQVIGAAMRVHRQLGCGFLEAVYRDALKLELVSSGIPFEAEVGFGIVYDEQVLESRYRADLVCFGEVLVELKAMAAITGREAAQVLNYLKASRLERGLLLNFGARRLEVQRLSMTHQLHR